MSTSTSSPSRSPIAALSSALERRLGRSANPPSVWRTSFGALTSHAAIAALLVLAVTGIVLATAYEPSVEAVRYEGNAELYAGRELPAAFASVVRISEDLPGGLLLRRVHVAASHLFMIAMAAHLLRVLATGAFGRPRLGNHLIGVALMLIGLGFVYTGELLPFGLVAGSSLRIAEAVLFSLPVIGEPLGTLLFETELPSERFLTIAWFGHVWLLPVAMAGLLALHVVLVHRRGPALPRRSDVDVTSVAVGRPLWPDAVARFALLTSGLTALLLVSAAIVPWADAELEGPFMTAEATNSAHPPWPMFFLTGGLRIIPAIDIVLGPIRLSNVLVAGVLLPGVLVAGTALYPFVERRLLADTSEHHVLDHPLDVPLRAGCVAAMTTITVILSLGAGVDGLSFWLALPVEAVVLVFQIALVVAPIVLTVVTVLAARRRVSGRGQEGR